MKAKYYRQKSFNFHDISYVLQEICRLNLLFSQFKYPRGGGGGGQGQRPC